MQEWRGDGESMEPMEEVPLKVIVKFLCTEQRSTWMGVTSILERLVHGWWREAGSWFQRRGEAYWKEQSVIRREDDVDGRASVNKDEDKSVLM